MSLFDQLDKQLSAFFVDFGFVISTGEGFHSSDICIYHDRKAQLHQSTQFHRILSCITNFCDCVAKPLAHHLQPIRCRVYTYP